MPLVVSSCRSHPIGNVDSPPVISGRREGTTPDDDWQGSRRIGCVRIRAAASEAEPAEETPPWSASSAGFSGHGHSPSSETSPCHRRSLQAGGLRWLHGACSAPDTATHVSGRRRVVWRRPPSPGETDCRMKEQKDFLLSQGLEGVPGKHEFAAAGYSRLKAGNELLPRNTRLSTLTGRKKA